MCAIGCTHFRTAFGMFAGSCISFAGVSGTRFILLSCKPACRELVKVTLVFVLIIKCVRFRIPFRAEKFERFICPEVQVLCL